MHQRTVAYLAGVERQLEGCHLVRKTDKHGIIAINAHSTIFSPYKTRLAHAFVRFVGQLEMDRALYEIRHATEADWEQYMPPSLRDWSDTDSPSKSSDDEAGQPPTSHRRGSQKMVAPAQQRHAVHVAPPQHRQTGTQGSYSHNPVAAAAIPVTSSHVKQTPPPEPSRQMSDRGMAVMRQSFDRTASEEECQSDASNPSMVPALQSEIPDYDRTQEYHRLARENPRQYFLEYIRDDREMFKFVVCKRIMGHPNFAVLLKKLFERFGGEAVFRAFGLDPGHRSALTRLERSDVVSSSAYGDVPVHKNEPAVDERDLALIRQGIIPTIHLRGYQLQAVEMIMSAGNFLVQALTGSGKTRIFVEVARRTLMETPGAKAFVAVPRKALTDQHKAEFDAHHFARCGFPVGAFTSQSSADFRSILCHSVIVITADKLYDHLNRREINFSHINLLVQASHTISLNKTLSIPDPRRGTSCKGCQWLSTYSWQIPLPYGCRASSH